MSRRGDLMLRCALLVGTLAFLQLGGAQAQVLLSPQYFHAIGDGQADDTDALNMWLGYLSTHGQVGYCGAGTYRFSSPLIPRGGHYWGFSGVGAACHLLYTGASTTADLVTIGDGVTQYVGATVGGFRISSSTTMTGGAALRFRQQYYYHVNRVTFDGNALGNKKLWHGFWADASSWGRWTTGNAYLQGDAVRATSGVELYLDDVQLIGNGPAGSSTGNGIHLGGGFGGLYTGHVAVGSYRFGLLVDTALVAAANNQLFVSNLTVFDGNTDAGVYLNDAVVGNKSLTMMGWVASTQAGNGIAIVNWASGTVNVTGAQVVSNSGSGVYVGDPSVVLSIDPSTNLSNNVAYGVGASSPVTIYGAPTHPFGNGSGNYHPNVTIVK